MALFIEEPFKLPNQNRDYLKKIPNNGIIARLDHRRVGVGVDRHDSGAGFHSGKMLNRP